MAEINETNENDVEVMTTLDILESKVQNATEAKDAKAYAEAYRAMQEAQLAEVDSYERSEFNKEQNRIETRGNILRLVGTILGTAIGAVITGGLKMAGDLEYQRRCQLYEDEGAYLNYNKHRRR